MESTITISRHVSSEARKEEDDWAGLAEAKARRKIQNRLNQRSYRRFLFFLSFFWGFWSLFVAIGLSVWEGGRERGRDGKGVGQAVRCVKRRN